MAEEIEKNEDELNEEAKLDQEALDAAPETPAEEPDIDPKDAVIGGFRRKNRDLELENARLHGQLESRQKPAESSPLEIAQQRAKEEGLTVEFTPELYQAQRQWEQKQSQAKSDEEIYARQQSDYDAGLGKIPVAEREELIARGGHLLTEGDKRNIWDAGKNSGRELKRILTSRIEQAGLQPKPKKKVDKPNEEPEEPKEPKEEAPELEEVFDPVTERAFDLIK